VPKDFNLARDQLCLDRDRVHVGMIVPVVSCNPTSPPLAFFERVDHELVREGTL
jgi:hypothetical protein